MLESFLGFLKGSRIHVRLAVTKNPLAVGTVYILFNGKKSIRVVEALSQVLYKTLGPEKESNKITDRYRKYLRANPPASRYTDHEYLFNVS